MSYRVRLPQTGESFLAEPGDALLGAALRAGVKLPSDCRNGACGTCRVRLLSGRVAYDEPPMALSPEEAAAGYALACQAHAASALDIDIASPVLAEPQRRTATVRGVRPFTRDVVHLELEVDGAQAPEYLPGQYLKVHLGDGETRNFSMASAPRGALLDFHVRRIPGGRFTEAALGRFAPGDTLEVELPVGTFFLRRQDYRPIVMVATGTGLAPLRSILDSLLDDPDGPQIALYWGMRTAADLYLDDELRSWEQRLAGFQYIPVLSRADGAWRGRRGHVQDAVCENLPDLSAHALYLCGSPAMIAQAKSAFAARGASFEHLYADGFEFQTARAPAEALP